LLFFSLYLFLRLFSQHFRHVIPMDQVEAISLFDTGTYLLFDECSVVEEKVVA